jgi:hypothetical protein
MSTLVHARCAASAAACGLACQLNCESVARTYWYSVRREIGSEELL